jgi:AcrR family transcriptional regulator
MDNETAPETATPVSTRDRLLDAAEALIYAGGIHATGVDAIVKQSNTARKSFYTYFESKDALVAAALERRDERWMNWFIEGTAKSGKTARKRLLGMFDVLREWFATADFHGCAFTNAAGEIASADDPIRIVARKHKERLLAFVQTQFREYAVKCDIDPRRVARLSRQWLILLDGAIAVALVSGELDAAHDARSAGAALLDHELDLARAHAKPDVNAASNTSQNTASSKRAPNRRTAT